MSGQLYLRMIPGNTLLNLLCSLSLLPACIQGHGNLVWPPAWWDAAHAGWYWDSDGHNNHLGCGVLDLPDNEFSHEHDGKPPDCFNYWFSNRVRNPGPATIPQYASQEEVTCAGQAGHHGDPDKVFPWNSPGSAPVYGSCGTLGGRATGL